MCINYLFYVVYAYLSIVNIMTEEVSKIFGKAGKSKFKTLLNDTNLNNIQYDIFLYFIT